MVERTAGLMDVLTDGLTVCLMVEQTDQLKAVLMASDWAVQLAENLVEM